MNRFPMFGLAAIALAFSTSAFAQPRDGSADAQQPIQARPGGPEVGPGSEKTVDVTKGTRLVLSNQAGEVVVRSWDQDRVRIQASHGARETISAETVDNTLRIRTHAQRQQPRSRRPRRLPDHGAALDAGEPDGHLSRRDDRRHAGRSHGRNRARQREGHRW